MNPFDDQNMALAHLQRFARIFAAACLKIVTRRLNRSTRQQLDQLFIEQRQVQCVNRLEIVVACGVARRLVAIEEIVVQRNRHRINTMYPQLNPQSLGKRRLAGRGRPGNQDQLDLLPLICDPVGNLRHFFFMQSFRNPHQFNKTIAHYCLIQLGNRRTAQKFAPALCFLQNLRQFGLIDKGRNDSGIGRVRKTQDEPRRVESQFEPL